MSSLELLLTLMRCRTCRLQRQSTRARCWRCRPACCREQRCVFAMAWKDVSRGKTAGLIRITGRAWTLLIDLLRPSTGARARHWVKGAPVSRLSVQTSCLGRAIGCTDACRTTSGRCWTWCCWAWARMATSAASFPTDRRRQPQTCVFTFSWPALCKSLFSPLSCQLTAY